MMPFQTVREPATGDEVLEVSLTGQALLNHPLLNKGSAFTEEERRELGLLGLLPPRVATAEEQLARVYDSFRQKRTDLGRYVFLSALQDRNETLFYRLLQEHIAEMLPVIYTPTVGLASQQYSHIYRRPRGLYLSYPERGAIDAILANVPQPDVRAIVVTDGERILGLGDLGVGGMGIPVGKLALYTLGGGIHPATTLPVLLDVGTDNQTLLTDPLYLGWCHPRVRGQGYDEFVDAFVAAVERRFPAALLQWEDFASANAARLLARYRERLCTFNDDIQGTGAVTVAGLLAAVAVTGGTLREQRVVFLGAGQAATGIADQIVAAMMAEGLTEDEARAAIWLVDIGGLLHTGRDDLDGFARTYAQPRERAAGWSPANPARIMLEDVVRHARPTILIGTAAAPGAFTEDIVREMARHVARPIIFPLSNPTSKSEAVPAALLTWTGGRALVATGSPFPDVTYEGRVYRIGQCNNAFIFPGVGLGVIATGARRVTGAMFVAAARALSALSPARHDPTASLYPALEDLREVSRRVALAVGAEAQRAGLAEETSRAELERRVAATMWMTHYRRYRRRADAAPK